MRRKNVEEFSNSRRCLTITRKYLKLNNKEKEENFTKIKEQFKMS
jgi:hypothetical protein